MKQICKISFKSIAVLCVSTLLCSLIFSVLYYFTWISTNTFHILNWIFGIVCFGISGAYLGMLAQKKALLHAFVIAMILLLFALLLSKSYTLLALAKSCSKIGFFVLCCMLSYTKLKKA